MTTTGRISVGKPKPRWHGKGDVYYTPSFSREGSVDHWTFFLEGLEPFCSCEGYQFNQTCRHIKEILDGNG